MASSRLSPRFEVSQTHGCDVRIMHRIPVQLPARLTCCVFVSGMTWKNGNGKGESNLPSMMLCLALMHALSDEDDMVFPLIFVKKGVSSADNDNPGA